MSSQIQITGETKVKSLTGVLVGTSGVVSSLNIDGSLGIPQLDVNGKILVSQLPNSVMEYKGTWDASTNTPTLVNGTGNQGDVYLCPGFLPVLSRHDYAYCRINSPWIPNLWTDRFSLSPFDDL
jgi:hypothetical protein